MTKDKTSGKGAKKTKCTPKIFFIGHFNLTLNRLTISEMHTYKTKCDIYKIANVVSIFQPLKRQSPLQERTNFATSFLIFEKMKV